LAVACFGFFISWFHINVYENQKQNWGNLGSREPKKAKKKKKLSITLNLNLFVQIMAQIFSKKKIGELM
jgi:hypothetical protein